ncbi:MAG TPA: protein kinase [Pyrinomonadaceae bacterium]
MDGLEQYVGRVLDEKYRLERLLGRGGMGAVYLATHLGTERFVALKLIAPEFMRNEEFVERFRREARAAGRLRHPNVVEVTDFGFSGEGPGRVAYLVMEYLDGCTLGDVLAEERRLPLEWVVDLLEQAASAVHEAHQQGIVHRDLKPDNIWLEPNRLGGYRVKVLDFGIAKLAEADGDAAATTRARAGSVAGSQPTGDFSGARAAADQEAGTLMLPPRGAGGGATEATRSGGGDLGDTLLFAEGEAPAGGATQAGPAADGEPTLMLHGRETADGGARQTEAAGGLTRVGAIMGTPQYMSPEQCRGGRLDARSDIYSLGVIAYQMLAGEAPFEGDVVSVMRRHADSSPPPLKGKNRKVPTRVARVVEGALAKDPAARPQTAAAFANSLRANAEGVGSLYRRAFALFVEHFPKFVYLSVLAHAPVIALTLLMVALYLAEGRIPKVLFVLCVVVVALLQAVAYFVSASIITGVTSLVVAQLYVAPLRPVQLGTAFAALRRRWRPFLSTAVRATLRIVLGFILFFVPGVVMTIRYLFYAPVVLMEGLEKKAALRRSRELAARSWRTVIIVSLLQFLIPITVSALLSRYGTLRSAAGVRVGPSSPVAQQFFGLVNIFVVPFMSIVPALLYLKMRQMGGEALGETIAQIEEVESARSRWQRRMRTRLTLHSTPSGRRHESGPRPPGAA